MGAKFLGSWESAGPTHQRSTRGYGRATTQRREGVLLDQVVAERITRFRTYFSDHVGRIAAISSPLYQKLLLSALLDALSKARYPELGNQNKARSLRMIEACFSWPHHKWVSMQQLVLHLTDLPETNLKSFVAMACKSMKSGHVYQLEDIDCPYEDLASLAEKHETRLLEANTHASLFYEYRNSLVHEFREPGYGMEIWPDAEPFYHSYIDPPRHELTYPVGFFIRSAKSSIEAVADHLQVENLDPYELYPFGSAWKANIR